MAKLLYIPQLFGTDIEVYVILVILGVPVYYFFRWIFKKRFSSNKRRTVVAWLATFFVTPLIYLLIGLLVIYCAWYYPKNKFDSKQWISDPDERYELSDDLVDSKMLIGKTKAQIKQLLGTDRDSNNTYESDNWGYMLGFRPPAIDPSYIEVKFKNNKVVDVEAHYHD